MSATAPSSVPAVTSAAALRWLDPVASSADYFLGNLPFLDDLQQRLGVARRYLSLGIAALLTSFVLFGLGQSLLCTAVGVLYPAYQSMKALEARPLLQESMVQWLTYWVCYSLFSVIEVFGDHVLYCACAPHAVRNRSRAHCAPLAIPTDFASLPFSRRVSLLLPSQGFLPCVAHAPEHQRRADHL